MAEVKEPCSCGRNRWRNTITNQFYCFHCQRGGTGTLQSLTPTPELRNLGNKLQLEIEPQEHNSETLAFLNKFPNIRPEQIGVWKLGTETYLSDLPAKVLKPLNKKNRPYTLVPGNTLLKGNQTLVLVEDFISGYCVHNAGFSVLVLNGTSLQNQELCLGFEQIKVWLDPDAPGRLAAYRLQQAYGWVMHLSDADPKYATNDQILEKLE